MILDRLVEQRLGHCGIVDFTMSMSPIANEINDDVAAEGISVIEGHAGDAHDGIHILAVHMENRNRLPLGNIGCKTRRVQLARKGGEAQRVVDNDMNRAAHSVAFEIGEIERFGPHALAGKSRVTMNQQWKKLPGSAFTGTILLGATS